MKHTHIFARYQSSITQQSLSELSSALLLQQKNMWQQCGDGYTVFDAAVQREILCNGFSAWLQYNPNRIVSTGANVDARSISERTCFLCEAHLPAEQQVISYNEKFSILANPFPIFKQHFTIPHKNHLPQSFDTAVDTFLSLAKDFSPHFSVFYNGPKCGASAPDHVHFQACPTNVIPIECYVHDPARLIPHRVIDEVSVFSLKNTGRSTIVVEGDTLKKVSYVLQKLIETLKRIEKTDDEPLVNILCSFSDNTWHIIIFPRTKHRPDAYFKEGDEKILVSPAAVDIGGLIITPVEKDFNRLDAAAIEAMYKEVSMSENILEQVIAQYK